MFISLSIVSCELLPDLPFTIDNQEVGDEIGIPDEVEIANSNELGLNLRVHIMSDMTMNRLGAAMTNDHITKEVVKSKIIPELNKIWAQAEIKWKIESIIDENVIKGPDYETQKRIVELAKRDENGHSDPNRLPPLYNFMDPKYRSKLNELDRNLFHIYIYPFIGNTSQGNAMRSFDWHTVVGSWSNKSLGENKTPIIRKFVESWSFFVTGSLARTIAHELGHVLTLTHKQCTNCLMHSGSYKLTQSQIDAARKEAKRRMK